MSDFNCPYCDAPFDVCYDDGHGHDEDVLHEDECGACGKKFVFRTAISFDYYPAKADCLNGAPHRMEKVFSLPKHWPDWVRCKDCGHNVRGKRAFQDCKFNGGPLDGRWLTVSVDQDQWIAPIDEPIDFSTIGEASLPTSTAQKYAVYRRRASDDSMFDLQESA